LRKTLGIFIILAALCSPKAISAQQPIRVNCGGPSYTDSLGNVWQADFGFNTGTVGGNASALVSGTTDPKLFQTDRWNSSLTTPLKYAFNVTNGYYRVILHFAETSGAQQSVGARIFNVVLEGTPFLQNFDIFAQAGPFKAVSETGRVNVTTGKLTIEFDNVVQNSVIHAIEILPDSSAAAPTLNLHFQYPDGTPVSGTLAYTVSSSLLSFQGNSPLNNGQAQCVIYSNPSSLGISTQFTVNLSLTDTAGHILWQLTVGMNPSQVNLGTVQSSALNVVVQKI